MPRGKAGYEGQVTINDVVISGMAVWNYGGEVRDVADDSPLNQEHKTFVALQYEGGEITMNGNFNVDDDAGQQLMRTLHQAGTEITNIKLYFSATNYLELDSTLDPASFATITNYNDTSNDKTGIASLSATLKVSGRMNPATTSADPGVQTVGSLDVADVTATLIGELVGLGGETTVDAYFEYGTSTSYGSDTSVSATTMTAVGVFDNDLSGLSASTTYYYRAVIEKTDTSKVYGARKTITTTS